MKMREFRESDWDGLAGAEKFPDGSNPLIGTGKWRKGEGEFNRCGEGFLLVADGYGVFFHVEITDDDGGIEEVEYSKKVFFPSPKEARTWLANLNLDNLTIEFVEDLCRGE